MALTSEQLQEAMDMILSDDKLLKSVSDFAAAKNAAPPEKKDANTPRIAGLSDAMTKVAKAIKLPGEYRVQK